MALVTVSRAALYGFGPFFSNPIKPLLNAVFGDGYDVAYKHFRRDHSRLPNLALHIVCLVFQLLANFALLGRLDSKVEPWLKVLGCAPGVSSLNMSTITAGLWVLSLVMFTKAPLSCSILSALSIWAAILTVDTFPVISQHIQHGSVSVFWLIMLMVVGFNKKVAGNIVFWIGWLFAWTYIPTLWDYHVPTEQVSSVIGVAIAVLVILSAALADPVKPVVVVGSAMLNVLAILCNEPALMYWACAYTAMGLQGASHDLSRQPATLLNLQRESDSAKKIAFEWSHVTFFPNLLFHSCYESTFGVKSNVDVKTD